MMFAILGIPLKKQLHLSDTGFGLVAAMPVLTGSLARVPLGIWTDRFGGRLVFFVTMLATIAPVWLVSSRTRRNGGNSSCPACSWTRPAYALPVSC
ncbi:MFS transporter, NNP family, nitrate/nitrite transporter [Paraburkholderia lycopersici]|uniref:MFS transporter, NNP family, nitrate/nitrite transporter n=1 Tax=Paraburkholderia lycopersici TaxID=416944 RepID=A0A1G6GUY0_9BURK|nr:MFS transporter, NNP family, nitrate/nitrite transporter [Paraburkholderia lycopersici]